MHTTRDGPPVAGDRPHGATLVVRRRGDREDELLVLHRAGRGPDGDRAQTPPAGARLPGEPVHAAAVRVLHEEAGVAGADVWAVDLSGDWAVFGCELSADRAVALVRLEHDRHEWLAARLAATRVLPSSVGERMTQVAATPWVGLAFRPMSRADFPDLVRWQAEPHVARWWSDEAPDVAGAERHYGPALDGADPTRMWVLELDGRSAGFVQDYRIGDHPEYAVLTGRPDAVGIDYAIGDPAWVHRGIGARVLWCYLRDVVLPHYPDAAQVHAAPDHRNTASLRVLEKVGFRQGLWFDEPQPGGRVDTVVGCTLDVRAVYGLSARGPSRGSSGRVRSGER